MKPIFLISWALFLLPLAMLGQSAERSLLASSGASFTNASYSIDYSVGEVVISTENAGGYTFLQGFQQPWYSGVGIPEPSTMQLILFPNPGQGEFHLIIPAANHEHISLKVLDILGQEVFSQVALVSGGTAFQIDMHLDHLSAGTYILHVVSGSGSGSLRFTKLSM